MRISYAQILVGIDRDIIDTNFVVEVGTGAAAAIADVADGVATVDVLAGIAGKAFQVSVTGGDPMTVINDDRPPISTHKVRKLHNTICRSNHRLPKNGANVDSRMKCAFPVKGIDSFAERTCDGPLDGPKIGG